MLKRIGLALAIALISVNAWAGAVSSLSAVTSVGGTDLFYDVQTPGAGGLKATAAQIATYALGQTTGDCAFSAFAITCTKLNSVSPGAFFSGTDAANLSGTLAAARLPASGVAAATYGDATHVPQFAVDATGRVTGVTNVVISGGGGSTSPGGTSGQIQYNNAGAFGGLTVGPTLVNNSGTLDTSAAVVAGTTQTVTSTQFRSGTTFVVTTAAQTLTLPVSTSLNANGGLAIQTIGQSVTLAPNAADAINGGTAGASISIPAGLTAFVSTDAAGNIRVSPTSAGGGGSGTVTTASVVSANGLAGTVANPTTTPAITLSTTVTGVLKGNGTAISAATAGTDYQAPITLTTTGTSGAATFSSNTLNIPQYAGGGGLSCPTGFTPTVGSCIWTQTASASASLSWTGLTNNAYRLQCDGLIGGNSTVNIAVQYGTSTGPTWQTASSYTYQQAFATSTANSAATATQAGILGPFNPITTGTIGSSYRVDFSNLQSTTLNKSADISMGVLNASSTYYHIGGHAYFNGNTSAITALRIIDIQATPSTFSGVCTLTALF